VGLLTWIENTGVAEYVRVSAYGYPAMITLHSLGLAIMVGLSVVLSLRVLGLFSVIPYSSLYKLLKIAWIGFIVNFISGGALFTTQAVSYMQDGTFLLKAALASGNPESAASDQTLKILAWLAIIAWTIGMVTGRLIAYL
jgi:cytochrome b subunit of formate dehydrogenase